MLEDFPSHNLLAEPLHSVLSADERTERKDSQ